MSELDLIRLRAKIGVAPWRLRLAEWVEIAPVQRLIIGLILLNAVVLGLETNQTLSTGVVNALAILDHVCLVVFCIELAVKLIAYRSLFWRSGWNVFDLIVIGFALAPGTGAWSVLRTLRVLRVLRLLTVVPSLRKVVAAFLHAIPGLMGVLAVMIVFFYTAGVLATELFGDSHPQWFGGVGSSLFTLFQIMTLESWSMGIVRPIMESQPWAWAFFVPFIVIATFTILNLFIGIIVSTMQELGAAQPAVSPLHSKAAAAIARIETELSELKKQLR